MTQEPAELREPERWPPPPDIEHIVTEDDEPVDNWYSEKVQRLLTSSLYASWTGPGDGRPFVAAANVGIFYGVHQQPVVPDVFVSCDVSLPEDIWEKRHRTYFIWEFGKRPEVVVEVVSNKKGGEAERKPAIYADIGIPWYVVHDPTDALRGGQALRVYELRGGRYRARRDCRIPALGLGLVLWQGEFEQREGTWLRWTDADGELLRTPAERAEQEHERAEQEHERAERLAAKLRALGVDPDAT